jgi:ribonuclease P/MRP protein subunit RPP40
LTFNTGLYPCKKLIKVWVFINRIRSFLSNRLQCVVIDRLHSQFSSVIFSGVPQGSVLEPILFIIYINDIHTVGSGDTALLLFADDAKLYSSVRAYFRQRLCLSPALVIYRLVQWANDWQLTVNINKCCVLSISSAAHSPPYFIDGSPLPRQNSYVDLEVTMDSKLSFEKHISNIVSKARQRVSILFRGFVTRNLYVMRQAFVSYIRPILEYSSIVWNPSFIFLI